MGQGLRRKAWRHRIGHLAVQRGRPSRRRSARGGFRSRRPRIDPLEPRQLLAADFAQDLNALAASTPFEAEELVHLNLAGVRSGGETIPVFAGQWMVQFATDLGETIREGLDFAEQYLSDHIDGVFEVKSLASTNTFLIHTSADYTQQTLVSALSGVDGVAAIEPNFLAWKDDTIPNDPRFVDQWALENTGQLGGVVDADIDAPLAWDINTGSGNIVVGVVDSGVNYNHVDLNDNMWRNPGEIPGDGIDNDGNGFVDDIFGYDFLNGDSDPFDDDGHGTAVAGIIAAEGDNGIGVAGINWDAQIMALKIFDPVGFAGTAQIVGAINYATMMRRDFGVNVVATNHSWGTVGFSSVMRAAIEAAGEQEMLFVASAGNANHDNDIAPQYPASYDLDNVISVAATDRTDSKASFSSFGLTNVDLGAPGVSTLTTSFTGGYRNFGGTSAAAPHVTGAAAFLFDTFPNASALEIKQALLDGTDPNADLAGITVSGGRLNLFGAVQAMQMQVVAATPDEGDVVATPPVDFTIETAHEYDPLTIDPADLTVNGIAADSVNLPDGTTLVFSFNSSPVVLEGPQDVAIAAGAFERLSDGDPIKAFDATFHFDTLPLEAVATTPSAGSLTPLPVTSIVVDFNEDVDPASVDVNDLELSQGSVVAASVVDGDTVSYDVTGITTDRQLIVEIHDDALTDGFGNGNLAFTTTIELDIDTTAAADFKRVEPLGGLIFASHNEGRLASAADADRFEFFVEAGQTISVRVTPLDPSAIVSAELLGLAGAATSSGAGQSAVIPPSAILSDGIIVVEITGDQTTDYDLEIVRNATIEIESSTSVQSITSSAIAVDSRRFGVVGTIAPGELDTYTIDLSVTLGRPVDILLSGQNDVSLSLATLELIAPDGTITTAAADPLGSGATNFDQAILGFVPDQIGDYTLRLSSPVVAEYGIVVSEKLLFEAEVNDGSIGALRSVDEVASVAGFIDDSGAVGFFEFTVDASQSSLMMSGGVGDPFSGLIFVPLTAQAPGSLATNLGGTIQAFVSNDSLSLPPTATVFAFEQPGTFQPGNAPADLAAAVSFPPIIVGGVLAVRDTRAGFVVDSLTIDSSGNFAADELSFSIGFDLAADIPGVFAEERQIDDTLVDNMATTPGTIQLVGGQLELTVPVEVRLLIPIPEVPAAGILDLTGQLVATAAVPGADDVYEITLEGGQSIELATTTPFDDPASTPGNPLDPAIEIRDAFGVPIASNDNSAADGRNAQLSFTAPLAGVYQIAIKHVSGIGEYVLHVDGHAGSAPSPFEVIATKPAAGEAVAGELTTVTIDFSDVIDPATVETADLTLDGVPAATVEAIDGNTLQFELAAPATTGVHNIELLGGSILSVDAVPLAGFNSQFIVDTSGPRVVSSSVQGGDVKTAGDFVVSISFDELLDETNLDATDVELLGLGSGLAFAVDSFSYDPVGSKLILEFAGLPEDDYRLTLKSGDGQFEDPLGFDLDGEPAFPMPPNTSGNGVPGGDFVVEFHLDQFLGPYPTPLEAKQPAGSLIYDPSLSGSVLTPSDFDLYSIELDADQTISLLMEALSPGLVPLVQVFALGGGAMIGSATAAAGETALLQTVTASTADTYLIAFRSSGGTTGDYEAQLTLNAALEEESHGGATNNITDNAQNINGSFIPLPGTSAKRGAVLGTTETLTTSLERFDLFAPNVLDFEFEDLPLPTGPGRLDFFAVVDAPFFESTVAIDIEGLSQGLLNPFVEGILISASQTSIELSSSQMAEFLADGSLSITATPSSNLGPGLLSVLMITLEYASGDIYRFDLSAGDLASLALTPQDGADDLTLQLLDASGDPLAIPDTGESNTSAAIHNLVSPGGGPLLAVVSGAAGTDYSLVVTRNADFDREMNNGPAGAQLLGPSGVALGHISDAGSLPRLFAFENGGLMITEIDPLTGAELNSFPSPVFAASGPDAGLATTANSVLVGGSPSSPIFELDPNTGATIRQITNPGISISGLAVLNGELFVNTDSGAEITVINLETGLVDRTLQTNVFLSETLTGDGQRLLGSSSSSIYEVDPQTGFTTFLGSLSSGSGEGLGVVGNELFVSTVSVVDVYDLETLAFKRTIGILSDMEGLGADVALGDTDGFRFPVASGDLLVIETTTPGDGPGQFVNVIDPRIQLFDPDGLPVAANDNGATDGRNARLEHAAEKSGTYTVVVSAAVGSPTGEYVLRVAGNSGAVAPFQVENVDVVNGAIFQAAPTEFTFDFSNQLLLTSLQPADVTLGGIAADVVEILDADTARFMFDPLTLPGDGTHLLAIAGGAISDLQATPIEPFAITLIVDSAPPVVEEVLVSSSQWTAQYFTNLLTAGLGDGGYSIPVGSGQQLLPLPSVNIDRVSIRFNEDVNVSQDDLQLTGLEVPLYDFLPADSGGFDYDPATFTATWTLDPADLDPLTGGILPDRLQLLLSDDVTDVADKALDGDWDNPTSTTDPASDTFPSGNTLAGGDFAFDFNVLPGDVNQNGSVDGDDVLAVRNAQFAVEPSPLLDVNGDGSVLGNDVILVRNRQVTDLPDPPAPSDSITPDIVDQLFTSEVQETNAQAPTNPNPSTFAQRLQQILYAIFQHRPDITPQTHDQALAHYQYQPWQVAVITPEADDVSLFE